MIDQSTDEPAAGKPVPEQSAQGPEVMVLKPSFVRAIRVQLLMPYEHDGERFAVGHHIDLPPEIASQQIQSGRAAFIKKVLSHGD